MYDDYQDATDVQDSDAGMESQGEAQVNPGSGVIGVIGVLPCESLALARRSTKTYTVGRLSLKREGNRFTLEGDVDGSSLTSDHFQLIFEALSIAADSDDAFAQDFALMLDEVAEQSETWAD